MPDIDPAPSDTSASDASAGDRRSGWEQVRSSLLKPSRSQLVVAVLLALLGFTSVVQVRESDRQDNYAGLRERDLVEILNGLTGTAERARREAARLERTRDSLRSETTSRQAALSQLQTRVQTLNIIAGLVPVTGPGLRITIEEGPTAVSLTSMLDLVQELRTAGAEAMQINGLRLAAQSSFDVVDGVLELDGKQIDQPYHIDVIGDPHTLHGALTFGSGPIEQLESYDGASVEVDELEKVDIESVRQPVGPVNAQPAQ